MPLLVCLRHDLARLPHAVARHKTDPPLPCREPEGLADSAVSRDTAVLSLAQGPPPPGTRRLQPGPPHSPWLEENLCCSLFNGSQRRNASRGGRRRGSRELQAQGTSLTPRGSSSLVSGSRKAPTRPCRSHGPRSLSSCRRTRSGQGDPGRERPLPQQRPGDIHGGRSPTPGPGPSRPRSLVASSTPARSPLPPCVAPQSNKCLSLLHPSGPPPLRCRAVFPCAPLRDPPPSRKGRSNDVPT